MFFLKMLLWSHLMLFWKCGQIFFRQSAHNLLPKIRNYLEIPGVFRKKIPSRCSSGHLECSLHNAAWKLCQNRRKLPSESTTFETCLLFSKLIFSKFLSEHKKGSFNTPPLKLPPKVQKNITPKTKNEKTKFAAKSQNVPVETPIAV